MTSPETSVSEAEVSAAAEAAISYMLANKADQRPAVVTAIHLVRAALTAAAQVREIAWKARPAKIRTDEGDELDEVYATLGIGGNFSAIDEIKRLQAQARAQAPFDAMENLRQVMSQIRANTPIDPETLAAAQAAIERMAADPVSGAAALGIRKGE